MAGASPVIDQWYDFSGDKSTAGESTPPILVDQAVEITVYAYYSTGAAAGKVKLQTIPDLAFGASTWATIGSTIDFAAQNSFKAASNTGIYKWIRVTIDTTVTTGTVRVYIIAAPV